MTLAFDYWDFHGRLSGTTRSVEEISGQLAIAQSIDDAAGAKLHAYDTDCAPLWVCNQAINAASRVAELEAELQYAKERDNAAQNRIG